MSNLIPFQFQIITIRAIQIDGERRIVGKGIARALSFTNSCKAPDDHCKGVTTRFPRHDALSRAQEATQ